jgi:hypothetical protein
VTQQDRTERGQRDHRHAVLDVDPGDDRFGARAPGQVGDQDEHVPPPVLPVALRERAHRDVAVVVQRQLRHLVVDLPSDLCTHPGGEEAGQIVGDTRDHLLQEGGVKGPFVASDERKGPFGASDERKGPFG